MGLREDLDLQGNQYGSVSAAFYYGFMVAEIPTTVLAQKSGKIGTYLGCCLVLWGIVLVSFSVNRSRSCLLRASADLDVHEQGCTAACNSYGSLFAVRFLLGVTESCVAPVLVLLISMFYPKRSQARRVASFYMQLGFTQIIGGAAAYGIFQLDTTFANWRVRAAHQVFGRSLAYRLQHRSSSLFLLLLQSSTALVGHSAAQDT